MLHLNQDVNSNICKLYTPICYVLQIFAEFIQTDHLSMILFSLFDNYILRCIWFQGQVTYNHKFSICDHFLALDEAMCRANKEEIYIPYGVGICGHVAKTKETINLKDAYEVVICNHNSILSYYPYFITSYENVY